MLVTDVCVSAKFIKSPTLVVWWFTPAIVAGIAIGIFADPYLVPAFFSGSEAYRLFIRLVIYPCLGWVVIFTRRTCSY